MELDEHNAFIYYKKSAEIGNATATNIMKKELVLKRMSIRIHLLSKSAGMGTLVEHIMLDNVIIMELELKKMSTRYLFIIVGHCYFYGIGVEKDEHMNFIIIKNQ